MLCICVVVFLLICTKQHCLVGWLPQTFYNRLLAGRGVGKKCVGDSDTQALAEQTSGFNTKEILGFLWTVALLKKHGKDVPKRLQTVQHMGKPMKGVIMDEWVLGHSAFV